MASDPEYRERERARQRDYARKRWQADPEWRAHRARIVAEYRERMRKERPERWVQWLEGQRMANRMRAELRGRPIPPVSEKAYAKRYGNGWGKSTRVPAQPLRDLIGDFVDGETLVLSRLAQMAGVSDKRLRDLMNGQRTVTLRNADKICVALEIPLALVYPEAS